MTMLEEQVLMNVDVDYIVDRVKSLAKENKVKVTKEKEDIIKNTTIDSLNFRGVQYLVGKTLKQKYLVLTPDESPKFMLPNWIVEGIIVQEVFCTLQGVKPTNNLYRKMLKRLEEQVVTGIDSIPEEVEDTVLLNYMKYNGAIIGYNGNTLKYVPPYLSNQIPYKDDLYVEVLSGTPFVHYTKDEVLKRSIEGILGYGNGVAETIHECTCNTDNNLIDIKNSINKLSSNVSDLADIIKNKIYRDEAVTDMISDTSNNTKEVALAQWQEDKILTEALSTQQKIKRKDFEKTFEAMIDKFYIPINFTAYTTYLEKFGNSIDYIKFKVTLDNDICYFNRKTGGYFETGESGETALVYIMNPVNLLERIINGKYNYWVHNGTWVLFSEKGSTCITASSVEELIILYLIDYSTNKDKVLKTIKEW